MNGHNPYEYINAHRNMTDEEVKACYMALAREHHPDRGGNSSIMAKINLAYAQIKTAVRRKALDETMRFTMAKCDQCEGRGAHTRRTKKGKQTLSCIECGGCGYVERTR